MVIPNEKGYSQSGSQRPVVKVNSLTILSPSLFYIWGKLLFLPVKEGAEYQIFQIDTSCTKPGDEQFPKTPTRCMEDLPLTVRTDLGEFWLYWAGPQLQVNNMHVPWVSLYNSSYNVIIIKGRVSQITPQQILSESTKQKQKHYPPWGPQEVSQIAAYTHISSFSTILSFKYTFCWLAFCGQSYMTSFIDENKDLDPKSQPHPLWNEQMYWYWNQSFRQKLGLWQHKQDRLGDLSQ